MNFRQFVESATGKNRTYELKAVMDLASSLRDIFKKYSPTVRKDAWKKITSDKGEKQVKVILQNPTHSLNGFRTL